MGCGNLLYLLLLPGPSRRWFQSFGLCMFQSCCLFCVLAMSVDRVAPGVAPTQVAAELVPHCLFAVFCNGQTQRRVDHALEEMKLKTDAVASGLELKTCLVCTGTPRMNAAAVNKAHQLGQQSVACIETLSEGIDPRDLVARCQKRSRSRSPIGLARAQVVTDEGVGDESSDDGVREWPEGQSPWQFP